MFLNKHHGAYLTYGISVALDLIIFFITCLLVPQLPPESKGFVSGFAGALGDSPSSSASILPFEVECLQQIQGSHTFSYAFSRTFQGQN